MDQPETNSSFSFTLMERNCIPQPYTPAGLVCPSTSKKRRDKLYICPQAIFFGEFLVTTWKLARGSFDHFYSPQIVCALEDKIYVSSKKYKYFYVLNHHRQNASQQINN